MTVMWLNLYELFYVITEQVRQSKLAFLPRVLMFLGTFSCIFAIVLPVLPYPLITMIIKTYYVLASDLCFLWCKIKFYGVGFSNYNYNQMTEHRQRSIHIHIEQMIIMWHKNRPNLYPIQFTWHRCQSDLLMVCLSLHIVHSNGQNLLFTAHSLNQILLPITSHEHRCQHS